MYSTLDLLNHQCGSLSMVMETSNGEILLAFEKSKGELHDMHSYIEIPFPLLPNQICNHLVLKQSHQMQIQQNPE
jgi:hypothetical protein